jgi:hypothetical protein
MFISIFLIWTANIIFFTSRNTKGKEALDRPTCKNFMTYKYIYSTRSPMASPPGTSTRHAAGFFIWILIVACLQTADNLRQFTVFSYCSLFKYIWLLKQVRFLTTKCDSYFAAVYILRIKQSHEKTIKVSPCNMPNIENWKRHR